MFISQSLRSKLNGILRKPNILDNVDYSYQFSNFCCSLQELFTGEKHTFFSSYKNHVNDTLNAFESYQSGLGQGHNYIQSLKKNNPQLNKKLIQHLYTYEKTRELYELLKKIIQDQNKHGNLNQLQNEFAGKMGSIKQEIINSMEPDFGVCEECIDLKIDVVKKYRKSFKKLNSSLWDLFPQDSQTK